jgi:hypothetical protein
VKPTPIARTPWSRLLHPRIAIAAMLVSTLLAGLAMQHSIDRLESAAQARAHLERQNASLHERFQPATPGAQAPALQQLRSEYDEAIASAAALGRWTAWASLAWMLGLGVASAWALRRAKEAATATPLATQPDSTAPQADLAAATAQPLPAATPARPVTRSDWAADLADIAREMRAVSALIGSEAAEPANAPCAATPATVALAIPAGASTAEIQGEPLPAPAATRGARVITLLDEDEVAAPVTDAAPVARRSFPARSALGLRLAA